jgi:hypothetical protein
MRTERDRCPQQKSRVIRKKRIGLEKKVSIYLGTDSGSFSKAQSPVFKNPTSLGSSLGCLHQF